MKPLCVCVLVCVVSVVCAAEEALPKDVQAAVDAYQEKVDAIVADAVEDIAEERSDIVKELGKVQQKITKKGDLDGALAIDALVDNLEAGPQKVTTESTANEEETVVDLFGAATPAPTDDSVDSDKTASGGVQAGDLDVYFISVDLVKDDKVITHYPSAAYKKIAMNFARNYHSKKGFKEQSFSKVSVGGMSEIGGARGAIALQVDGASFRAVLRVGGVVKTFFTDKKGTLKVQGVHQQ